MTNVLCKIVLFLFMISTLVCTGLVLFASSLSEDDCFFDDLDDFNESDW